MKKNIFINHLLFAFFLVACSDNSDSGVDSNVSINDMDGDGVSDENDCAPTDNTLWDLATYNYIDKDYDGYFSIFSGQLCIGDSLPQGYLFQLTTYMDCNDDEPSLWRYVSIYQDIDGDGVGSGAGTPTCIGTAPPTGNSLFGYDPIDSLSDIDSTNVQELDIPPALLVTP